jgi:ATP-dependent protease HslVU (ClpYQ) peptidase subunit
LLGYCIVFDLLAKLKTALEADPKEIADASSEIADDDEIDEMVDMLDNIISAMEDLAIHDMGLDGHSDMLGKEEDKENDE